MLYKKTSIIQTSSLCLLSIASLTDCANRETTEQLNITFKRNVESCVCRHLVLETNNYSYLLYEQMLRECNATVHSANLKRYPPPLVSNPGIDTLRCEEVVEDWREVVQEYEDRQSINRTKSKNQS